MKSKEQTSVRRSLERVRLYIMATLTAIAIKLLNPYLSMYYLNEFENIVDNKANQELIDFLQEKLLDGEEIYLTMNEDTAKGTFGISFDSTEEEEDKGILQ